MQARDSDVFLHHINASDGRAQRRHGLGQDPSAAADIENANAVQRALNAWIQPKVCSDLCQDKRHSDFIQAMKRPKWAGFVPPEISEPGVVFNLPGIDAVGGDHPGYRARPISRLS